MTDIKTRLRKRADQYGLLMVDPPRTHPDAAIMTEAFDTVASLERRVQDLEGALKPFAELAVEFIDDADMRQRADDRTIWGFNDHDLTYGDFRNARRALSKGTGQ